MASKIILDVNIIMDISLKRSDDLDELVQIYSAIVAGKFRCHITTSMIHICGHWLRKAFGLEETRKVLLTILNDLKVIDAPHDKVVASLHSNFYDIEDSLQYYTALHHNIDCFISRDKQFINSALPQLPVYHPKEFIKRFMS